MIKICGIGKMKKEEYLIKFYGWSLATDIFLAATFVLMALKSYWFIATFFLSLYYFIGSWIIRYKFKRIKKRAREKIK